MRALNTLIVDTIQMYRLSASAPCPQQRLAKHLAAGTAGAENAKIKLCCFCIRRADVVIDSSSEDVAERVEEATGGEGAFAGIDPVAMDSTAMVRRPRQKMVFHRW